MIYVIIAYRWGYQDAHSYLVGARTDFKLSVSEAEEEAEKRGGKYGVAIYECREDLDDVVNIVKYFPSRYGEIRPKQGFRNEPVE